VRGKGQFVVHPSVARAVDAALNQPDPGGLKLGRW
jgi:hypothetical protein